MLIGLYLQEHTKRDEAELNRIYEAVKQNKLDLFVYPELCHTPFSIEFDNVDIFNESDRERLQELALKFSKGLGCAVIFGGYNFYNGLKRIYNIFANAFVIGNDTSTAIYVKHTATDESPLGFKDYKNHIDSFFPCIILKGKKLGITNCYDCNHAAFSRVYGKKGVDIIINSTGGNVKYNKWYRYNKVRAIENNAFSFCTMGYNENGKENSYTYGFAPNGKHLSGTDLLPVGKIGNITVYDTDNVPSGLDADRSFDRESLNRLNDYAFDVSSFDYITADATALEENLFVLSRGNENIVFCVLNAKNIIEPENALRLLYNEKLRSFKNKRYIIVNHWKNIDDTYFKTVLSDLLRVRSMENYCAVVLLADNLKKCYQCTRSRDSQSIRQSSPNVFNIDLQRAKGPEMVWQKKQGRVWRKGYQVLIDWLNT